MGSVHDIACRAPRDQRPLEERLQISTKLCVRCREEKPKDEFAKEKRNRDGCKSYCSKCQSEMTTKYHQERRAKDWAFRLIQNARTSTAGGGNTKKKIAAGLKWDRVDLTVEYLRDLYNYQDGKCAYFNVVMELDGGMGLRSITLDRIDCGKGYVQGNVILACRAANLGRSNSSVDDMLVFVELIKRS